MSDEKKKDENKKDEKKSAPSSPRLSTRMRPKPADPIDQKLKEVKEHQPHFDHMSSYMNTLVKPVDGSTMTKKPSPASPSSPEKPSSAAKKSSPAKQTSPAKKASSMDTSNQDYSSDTEMTTYCPSEVRLPGTPIAGSFEEPSLAPVEQHQFVQATITPPPIPELEVPPPSPMEVVNTWECAPVEPTIHEVEVMGSGMTMFVRNPDGSYDLYTGIEPEVPPEDVYIREITLDDGPLVILTRDDEGNLTYDPEDSVTIDIADSNIYVLNTDNGVACFMENEENRHVAGGNMDADNLIEYLPEEEDPTVNRQPYEHVGAEEVIELDPESFAVGEVAGKRVVDFVCETGHRPQQQRQPVDPREQMPVRLRLRVKVAPKEPATADQGRHNSDQCLWDVFGYLQ